MTDEHGLRSVDLFSGAGGLSLGLQQAGFETVFALDNNRHACRTLRLNLSEHGYEGDVDDFPAERICEITGREPGEYTLVCGGPPCQGFSLQRRGARHDARNSLVTKFVAVAVGLRPTFILMENVPALLGKRGETYTAEAYSLLSDAGYDHESAILDAADYGVPQHRQRAFIVAWLRDSVPGFEFPEKTHGSDTWATVRSAIGDLPEPPDDFTEHPDYANHTRVRISAINLIRISCVPEGGGRKDIPVAIQLPCHRNDNGHRHLDVYGRMSWAQPAPTITAMFDNFTRGRFAHPTEDRVITGREGARLQTFPDSFRFYGGKKDVARQIGNAVPAMLAMHLGRALRDSLEGRVGKRVKQLGLF